MENIKKYVMNAIRDYEEIKHLTNKKDITETLDNYVDDDQFIMGDYKSTFIRFILEGDLYHVTDQINVYDDDANLLYNDDINNILLEIESL